MKLITIASIAFHAIVVASLGVQGQRFADADFWRSYIESVDSYSPPPTPRPTRPPTPRPTPRPSPGPTPRPTFSPTGVCAIDSCLNCTAMMFGEEIDCESIPPESQPICECENCVREVKFKYTGLACSPEFLEAGKCLDRGPNPFVAGYRVTSCVDSTRVFKAGQVRQGDYITIGDPAGGCLPTCMTVEITVPTGALTQIFDIDSSCDGDERGLILENDYGAFESTGYSCSESDTHNCIQGVNYGLKVCNVGSTSEQIYEWFLTIDKEEIDILQDIPPEDIMLEPGDCFYDTYEVDIDRCNALDSCAEISASATNPLTGLPPDCSDKEEVKFGWDQPETLPPTPAPSPAPSPSPTSSCIIDISLTGCPRYNSTLDNNCAGRPQVMTFRYIGGDCSQSDNLQPRQKFGCIDENGGPPIVEGTESYITVVPQGDTEFYFNGIVAVGEKYTLNENFLFDRLQADMTIQIYDSPGGNLLQQVDLHLSCSQPLFLFDKFGASQVTEWIETDGRIVSDKQLDVQTGTIEVQLDASSDILKPVRLLEMSVLTNTLDEPIDYTPQIAGVVLNPGDVIELDGFGIDIELTERTRYTFFTTLVGETLDGTNTCNGFDFLECTIGFNLNPIFPTLMPTPRPTITPFPTLDPKTNACDVSTDISCSVLSLQGITCDQIKAPASETCPQDAELLVAYLKYDGSFGDSIFLEVVCDKSTTYVDREIQSDETFLFRTRSNSCEEVDFIVYTSDPMIDGSFLDQSTVTTSCPGPWTLGSTIAGAFTLDAFIDTVDDGISFELHIDEVEVQLDYTVINSGQFPLTVLSGEISEIFVGTDSGLGGVSPIAGLPLALAPRSQEVVQRNVEVVKMAGRAGDIVTYGFNVLAQTANQFALPCEDGTSQIFTL